MIGSIFFAVCGLACLVGALTTILARSPVRGAMGLLATIFGIAGLFLELDAQFMAAIQLIVYAGAVVVLFVFVIMLLGADSRSGDMMTGKAKLARGLGGLLLAAVAVLGLRLLARATEATSSFPVAEPGYGTIESFADQMFKRSIVPFELTTALLIVAVVGAIAVAKGKQTIRRATPAARGVGQMFHGPIHPRDAAFPPAAAGGQISTVEEAP